MKYPPVKSVCNTGNEVNMTSHHFTQTLSCGCKFCWQSTSMLQPLLFLIMREFLEIFSQGVSSYLGGPNYTMESPLKAAHTKSRQKGHMQAEWVISKLGYSAILGEESCMWPGEFCEEAHTASEWCTHNQTEVQLPDLVIMLAIVWPLAQTVCVIECKLQHLFLLTGCI